MNQAHIYPFLAFCFTACSSDGCAPRPHRGSSSNAWKAKARCPDISSGFVNADVDPNHGCDPDDLDCTKNSPVVNIFPINGLDASGTGNCNGEDVNLVAHSLNGGNCGEGANLVLDSTEMRLVGKKLDGSECAGVDLATATFKIESKKGEATLTIDRVDTVTRNNKYEAYEIAFGNEVLCTPRGSESVRVALGLDPYYVPDLYPEPEDEEKRVIVVAGNIYNAKLRRWPQAYGKWFNLACVSDALAEIYMEGRYMRKPGFDHFNIAALHMFTASYAQRSFTVKGMELKHSGPGVTASGELVEAHWTKDGATCLTEPRLLHATIPGARIPEDLPRELKPWICRLPFAECDAERWKSYLTGQLGLAPCGDQDALYTSSVSKDSSTWSYKCVAGDCSSP